MNCTKAYAYIIWLKVSPVPFVLDQFVRIENFNSESDIDWRTDQLHTGSDETDIASGC